MNKYNQDILFGNEGEEISQSIISDYFNCVAAKTSKYDAFDYIDKSRKLLFELKRRRNNKDKYPTTIVPYTKILKGMTEINKGYKIYFCFLFTDGLYYYELKDFKEEWVKTNGRLDRGRPEFRPHYNIPITELVKIEYEELKELVKIEHNELEGYDELANSFCNIEVK